MIFAGLEIEEEAALEELFGHLGSVMVGKFWGDLDFFGLARLSSA